MRKLLVFLVLAAAAAMIYSVFSDPKKRERILGTIERSTGVDLSSDPEDLIEEAGRAVGSAAENALQDLGDTITDPEFHRKLERLGKDLIQTLDSTDLKRLKRDLEREAGRGGDYEEIFRKYFPESGTQ